MGANPRRKPNRLWFSFFSNRCTHFAFFKRVDVFLGRRYASAGQEIGELRVDVDARGGRLTELSCNEPGRWLYRYRFLKAATAMPGNLVGPANLPEVGLYKLNPVDP
jgi:hypothetical protein